MNDFDNENFREFRERIHKLFPELFKRVRNKNVTLLMSGSNSLYEPDILDLINNSDLVVGVNHIRILQKKYPKVLGKRLDFVYPPRDNNVTNKKRVILKNDMLDNPLRKKMIEQKKVWQIDDGDKKVIVNNISSRALLSFRLKLQSGVFSTLSLLLCSPKLLYVLGMNFFMKGTLKSYNKDLKNGWHRGFCVKEQCTDKDNENIDYRSVNWRHQDAYGKGSHCQYFNWFGMKQIYNSFSNITGDSMFLEIMNMTDDEYIKANNINIK